MADTAALYGLVGAIGGALLGAGAVVAAPLLQNRGAARTRHWGLAEAEVNRLIKIRSSTRAVLYLQSQTVDALAAGREVAPAEFAAAMSSALSVLREAADDALADGLVFPQSPSTRPDPSMRRERRRRGRSMPPPYNVTSPIVMCLQRLGDDIRSALDSPVGEVSSASITSLRGQVTEAERLREELISLLLDRMERARNCRA
ncbi:hypothetical protein [Streptomyces lavenduligriseus]|uniref:Protein kilB n=1 Tax=Streptomyces lavenduligriseus TaxID=67315 RepID=A0ABT0P548_9ACTN|nr:hypothetical protein [Streptomyces lavenduligriseus]MCL3998122.1 hypothetical protein [Streptomyces lavenduligriseus]